MPFPNKILHDPKNKKCNCLRCKVGQKLQTVPKEPYFLLVYSDVWQNESMISRRFCDPKEAYDVAEECARQFPGRPIFVLKAVDCCQSGEPPVTWDRKWEREK
jgi:hypothetical protein